MDNSKLMTPGKWYTEFDENGNCTSAVYEDSYRKLLGFESEEEYKNSQETWESNIYPDDEEAVNAHLAECLKKHPEGKDYNIEYRMMTKNGYRWFHDYGRCIRREDGSVLRCEGVVFDIQDMMDNLEIGRESGSIVRSFAENYNVVDLIRFEDKTVLAVKAPEVVGNKNVSTEKFERVIGYYLENIVFEADREKMRRELDMEYIQQKVKENGAYIVEHRVISDGRVCWAEMSVLPISEKTVALGIVAKNEEIILKHLQEKELEDYYAIFSIDLDTELLTILKRSDLYPMGNEGDSTSHVEVMKKFAESQEGETREFFLRLADLDHVRKVLLKENKRTYKYKSILLGNKDRWISATAYVVARHEDGTAAVFTLGFNFMDTLEADRMEMRLEVEKALTKAQNAVQRNNTLHEIAKSGPWSFYLDEDDNIISTNYSEDLQRIINIELPDGAYAWTEIVHPEDLEGALSAFNATLEDKTCSLPYDVIYRMKNKYGEYHWFHSAGRKIRYADGTGEFFGMHIDITDEIQKERGQQKQLEEALFMAQSANRAKTTFLNNMSHDIRTPMNAIIGYTGLAASHIENKDQVRDYLSKISQSSNHLLSLINDVLDMSRIESGKMNLDEKPENLPEIIHTLRDIIQSDIHAKQLDFYIDAVDVNDENILCDKLRLNQMLLNVISNAVKYTPAGGTVTLRILERAVKKNGYATYEFRIKDNGIGMSKEFLSTIYDPFTRVKSSTVSGIQGTGLGMAITKNIVDMFGGKIEIESEPGKGTEVILTFDFKLQNAPKEPVVIPELKGLKGLVVDDDANACLSVSNMLRDIGMKAEWCTSGKEAVIRAGEGYRMAEPFRVYIIDWLMPDMNGVETTRRIRKEIGEDTPIIILTSYDWSDIEDEAREAGVTAFVNKPLFPSDLNRVLNRCLGIEGEKEEDNSDKYDFAGKKILLVEDNILNREIATELLEEEGFIIDAVEDGNFAVEKMKNAAIGDYNLVLMDIQMPIMDGYEATRKIRALGTEISKIPILAMTANAFEEDKRAALEAGMNEHIAKPIDIEQLKIVLAKFL